MGRYIKLTVIPLLAMVAVIALTALAARIPHAPEHTDTIWRVGFGAAMLCYCMILLVLLYRDQKRGRR